MPKLTVAHETWPLAGSFAISRGAKTTAEVLTVTLEDANGAVGRGECVPYARYGETVPAVMEALEGARSAIEAGIAREDVPVGHPHVGVHLGTLLEAHREHLEGTLGMSVMIRSSERPIGK